jgi:glycerophosphoryl diester phosphodiesterase
MDLSFTKDKEVVLWHDWDPDDLVAIIRQLGLEPNVKYQPFTPGDGQWRRKIHKLTLEELRSSHGYCLKKKSSKVTTHIPSLAEFFQWSSKQANLEFVIFDIKTPEEQKKLIPDMLSKIKALIQLNQPQFTILLMSPIKEIINEMKKVAADLNFTYDIELPIGIVLEPASYSAVSVAVKYENHYASSGRPTVLQLGPWTTYRRLMQFDLKEKTKYENSDRYIKNLLAWTINRKREMKCLVKMGVDGMVTDRPDRLKKIYDRLNNA